MYFIKKNRGIRPNAPKEQSIRIQKVGISLILPQIKASGNTAAQASIAQYTIQMFRTGFIKTPTNAIAMMM